MKRAIVCKRASRTRRRRKVDRAQSGTGGEEEQNRFGVLVLKSALVWSLSAHAVVFYAEGLPTASIQTRQWLNGSLRHWACLIRHTARTLASSGSWNPDAACTFVVLLASIRGSHENIGGHLSRCALALTRCMWKRPRPERRPRSTRSRRPAGCAGSSRCPRCAGPSWSARSTGSTRCPGRERPEG